MFCIEKLETKKDLLTKLRTYDKTPDDDVIRIKKQIEEVLINCPEILYLLNESSLYSELFDSSDKVHWKWDEKRGMNIPTDECRLNWEWDESLQKYEHLGEWDRYFGSNANIRPFLFIPDTQTDVKHYICYQVSTEENVRYNSNEKLLDITFTIFIHGGDRIDKVTGLPRHDLIASLIREKFAWIGLEIPTTTPIYNKESTTDNNYVVRTLKYQCTLPNDIVKTSNGVTAYNNKRW